MCPCAEIEKNCPELLIRPRLLRTKAAARYLGISPAQLRNLAVDGLIPVIRNGEGEHAPFLFDVRDLDTYIDSAKVRLE